MDIADVARDTGAAIEDIGVLAEAGLDLDQIAQLLRDPAAVVSWTTTIETSDTVRVLEDGTAVLSAAGQRARACGWAITRHDGSAFAIRCARLNLRTDWCWDHEAVLSHAIEHSVSTTLYGNAAGWRVDPSHEGSSAWVSEPDRYRTEVKADWKLVLPPSNAQVQSGTAFARHLISAEGTVVKEQGGWPR